MDEIILVSVLFGSLCALPAMVIGKGVFRCFFGGLLFPWGAGIVAMAVAAEVTKGEKSPLPAVIAALIVSFLAMAGGVALEKRARARKEQNRSK